MLYKAFRPLIFCFKPETAHNLAIIFLKYLPMLSTLFCFNKKYSNLKSEVFGVDFNNPIGLAAGFDKNAQMVLTLRKYGFGFIEVGTVTLKAQIGNIRPRIFRLTRDRAVINMLGFNNIGSDEVDKNICKIHHYEAHHPKDEKIVLGINIGKNKDAKDYLKDYLYLLEHFYIKCSYITINISSPNTKNLREIQKGENLDEFLKKIMQAKLDLKIKCVRDVPILLKIAPDLDEDEQQKMAKIILKHNIDGVIVSNTTIERDVTLKSRFKDKKGGLSGKPLFDRSNQVLANIYRFTKGKIPIIGVGGVFSAEDAYKKIKLGASLVQIYTAFTYEGFGLVEKIKKDLSQMVADDGYENIQEAVGVDVN